MIGQLSRQTVEVLSACRRTTPCNNVCRPLKGVGPQYCPDYAAGPMYVCATWSVVVRPEQSSSWLAVFVAYGVYALAQTRSNPQLRGALMAVLSVLGGIGLVFNRQWSKYCIYVVSAAVGGRGFLRGALCAVLAIQHCRRVSHFAATRYSHRRCCSRQQLFGNEAFSCGGDEELTWCQAPNKAYLDSSVKLSAWQERHHLTHRSLNCDTNAKGNGA